MVFAVSCAGRHGLEVKVLGTMLGDIIAYIHEFLEIFLLLAAGDAGGAVDSRKLTAEQSDDLENFCVDRDIIVDHAAVIFVDDLVQDPVKLLIGIWKELRSYKNSGIQHGHEGFGRAEP